MINNLLLTGGPTHDFATTSAALASLFAEPDRDCEPIHTTVVDDPDEFFARLIQPTTGSAAHWDLATVAALRWRMEADRYASQRDEWAYNVDPRDCGVLHEYVRNGGGLLALHTAAICFDSEPCWHALIGATWNWERSSHPEVAAVPIEVTEAAAMHPITSGVARFEICDEIYGFLDVVDGLDPLLVGRHSGEVHPVLWARNVGAGRVVTDLLGHGIESISHSTHRSILRRAATWAIGDR